MRHFDEAGGHAASQLDEDRWDLDVLYSSLQDPRIEADRDGARRLAADFAERYRGRIGRLDGPGLFDALQRFEALMRACNTPNHYCSLRFAVETDDDACQAAHSQAQAFDAEIDQVVAFFAVELKALDAAALAALPGSEALAPYRHYLERQQVFAPYTLSEDAERTTARKDVTGKSAWVQFYTQLTSALRYRIVRDGEERLVTRGELRPLRTHPDRDLRDQAVQAVSDSFEPHRGTVNFVFNTLFEDHRLETAARGYDEVMRYSVLKDDLTPPVVDSLIQTVNTNRDIVHRFHALRARRLGLSDYGTQDLLAPAFGSEPDVTWPRAKELVFDAFSSFSPRAGAAAQRMFDERWIDVHPQPGKSTGAFCSPGLPPEHPFVLLNYAGTLDDAFTLAHELGHSLHFTLSLGQRPLNYWTGLPLAETASVFGEMWLTRLLLDQTQDPKLRRQLLDRQISDAIGTAWTQIGYINWERKAHARRASGSVPAAEYSSLWGDELRALYGDAVQIRERDQWRWQAIPHFVFARFYCYSYAFGKLLTLGLYSLWQEQGDAFVERYLALLAAGGSQSPQELLAPLGLDLTDPGFWQRATDVVRGYLEELESLVEG